MIGSVTLGYARRRVQNRDAWLPSSYAVILEQSEGSGLRACSGLGPAHGNQILHSASLHSG